MKDYTVESNVIKTRRGVSKIKHFPKLEVKREGVI